MANEYVGMTINERLYISGYMDKFDKAVTKNDVNAIISILKKVDITDELSIRDIIRSIGLKYE